MNTYYERAKPSNPASFRPIRSSATKQVASRCTASAGCRATPAPRA